MMPLLISLLSCETDDGRDALHLFQIAEGAGGISMRLLSSQPTLGKAPCDRIHSLHLPSGESAPDIVLEPGSGPRHLVFSSDGRFAYLINELSGYVTVLANRGHTLEPLQYALCDSVGGHGSADIHLSPDGRFLYASNRLKDDGIAVFSVDRESGLITKVEYQLTGIHPRNFAITPNGRFLLCACRNSNEVQIYTIDPATGLLTPTGDAIQMPQPVFVMFF